MSGIIGIYSKESNDIPQVTYYGLYALQHRGQVSCGMAVNNNGFIDYYKGLGLIHEVFTQDVLSRFIGNMAIGHVRYGSQYKGREASNIQPLASGYKKGALAISLDGRIINSKELKDEMEAEGVIFQTDMDAEVIAKLIAKYSHMTFEEALLTAISRIKGSYSMIIMTQDELIGARDPYGIKPLALGKLRDGHVLASESCAFDTIGAEHLRDIKPGEVVSIDKNGVRVLEERPENTCHCLFEFIYFARPDSYLDGRSVYLARVESGKQLFREHDTEADIVIGAPDSGIEAAIGYAEESNIPYGEGLIKNRYIGRTFIQPTQKLREIGVRIKLNALNENIRGKRVVLVDDSIVRGTTIKRTVQILREAGAKEIHVRVSSPPVTHTCYLGMDTPDKDDLIAANMTVEEICKEIGADSLYYLSLEGLIEAIGKNMGFCTGCFNGRYPI
ncbi:MAG: amidophosphoribosyltransferase [Tissierellia bacterium]|nr:amidophosphoribosyltransferase [Tissierellia bacterium]